jgi:LacI family transcriptional regulator
VSVLQLGWAELRSEKSNAVLEKWLTALPKSVAIMACSDRMAMALIRHATRRGFSVPENIAVLGVDDDEMFSARSEVPLSSVKIDHSLIGYEGIVLLEALLRGKSAPTKPTLIAPQGVTVRASTDVLAIDDRAVAVALKFIRQNAFGDIDLAAVAERAGLSRTPLQRRFREALGRSIHDEIVRVRLDRAKRLLTETELSIPVVAERSGIQSQAYLCRLFRSKLATTPARYRREGARRKVQKKRR